MGSKDNIITADNEDSIGFYKDIRALYIYLIKDARSLNDHEEVNNLREQLEEIRKYKDYGGLLVLSMNNGMGFTCEPYREGGYNM